MSKILSACGTFIIPEHLKKDYYLDPTAISMLIHLGSDDLAIARWVTDEQECYSDSHLQVTFEDEGGPTNLYEILYFYSDSDLTKALESLQHATSES